LLDHHLNLGTDLSAEALTSFPDLKSYHIGPEGYLEHINKVKQAVNIPVIASLNGVSAGGWVEYAKKMQDAGADALELNMYYVPADPMQTSAQVEEMYLELVRAVKANLQIPVAVKLSLYFSAFANMAKRFEQAGATGLVLFNRFYQPDFDLENLEVVSNLELSTPDLLRVRLRWIAMLYGKIKADMAITGGVHNAEDVVKSMMAGAKVAMMTSALLHDGIDYLSTLLTDLVRWLEDHEYESIQQMQGSLSAQATRQPGALRRANYIKELNSYRSGH
jgi:dihydroorotate dehydrogenase (fumarate)